LWLLLIEAPSKSKVGIVLRHLLLLKSGSWHSTELIAAI
jgi:hypothetical protein